MLSIIVEMYTYYICMNIINQYVYGVKTYGVVYILIKHIECRSVPALLYIIFLEDILQNLQNKGTDSFVILTLVNLCV